MKTRTPALDDGHNRLRRIHLGALLAILSFAWAAPPWVLAWPPTVTITSPMSGSFVRGTITIRASASGETDIAGVQFFVDGVALGAEDAIPPYDIAWDTTTVAEGSYILTAVARDIAGETATSAAVTVTVDNTPPTVAITSPAHDATVRGTVTVAASASDNTAVVGVRFLVNSEQIGVEDTTAPYEVVWDTTAVADGTHLLFAEARDAAGNFGNAPAVHVTVANAAPPTADTMRPTVSITFPTFGATVSGTITVTAEASDDVGVVGIQFFVDDVALGPEGTTSPYSVPWDTTTASDGSHTLAVVARDAAGNRSSAAVTVTVSNGDTTPPAVSITSPTSGDTVSGIVIVTASASDNVDVVGVQFFVDGAPLGIEDTTAPYEVPWDTMTTTDGSYTLTALARDAAGNTATSAGVSVTVANAPGPDTTPPTVAITAPESGATVSGTTTVTASASDDVGVAGVGFFVDGVAIGVEDTTAPYEVPWDTTTVTDGSYTLTALARDAAGNTATSAGVTVTVANAPGPDATPPTVAITAPESGATVSGTTTMTASASDDVGVAGVGFFVDGVAIGVEDTTAPYEVPWDTTTVTDGSYTLTAVARDAAGNAATSAGVTVTVANAAPPAVTRIEETRTDIITYTGTWLQGNMDREWSGNTAALSVEPLARATLSFTGTGVSWIGFRGPQTGIANVFLDGTLVATVNAYAETETVQAVLFAATGLDASVPHTLAIEVTGTKDEAAIDFFIVVDAFDVTP